MSITISRPKYLLTDEQEAIIYLADKTNLIGIGNALNDQFGNPDAYAAQSFEARIRECLECERNIADTANFKRLFRKAMLPPYSKEFSQLLCLNERLKPNDLAMLHELKFMLQKKNVIIQGVTGSGKTSLAVAVALEAMRRDYSTLFYTMNDLAGHLENQTFDQFKNFKRKLSTPDILVIDDWGLSLLSQTVLVKLSDIVNARYGHGSIIVTSQLTQNGLVNIPNRSIVSDALFDRLFNKGGLFIKIEGGSFRGTVYEVMEPLTGGTLAQGASAANQSLPQATSAAAATASASACASGMQPMADGSGPAQAQVQVQQLSQSIAPVPEQSQRTNPAPALTPVSASVSASVGGQTNE